MFYQFHMVIKDTRDIKHARAYCTVTFFSMRAFHFVNIAAEVHIALVFLAVTYKALKTLRCLRCTLRLIWPIGFAAAAVDVVTANPQWDRETIQCYVGRNNGYGTDLVLAVFINVFIAVCLACYVLSLVKVCRAEDGHTVQRRVWVRMSCYLLMALFINGPTWVYYTFNISKGEPSKPDVVWLVTRLLLNLGGFLNFLLYAQQSRDIRRGLEHGSAVSRGLRKTEEADVSFNVRFRSHPSFVEEVEGRGSPSSSSPGSSAALSAAPPASSELLGDTGSAQDCGQAEDTLKAYYEGGFDIISETSPSTMSRICTTWQLMARIS